MVSVKPIRPFKGIRTRQRTTSPVKAARRGAFHDDWELAGAKRRISKPVLQAKSQKLMGELKSSG